MTVLEFPKSIVVPGVEVYTEEDIHSEDLIVVIKQVDSLIKITPLQAISLISAISEVSHDAVIVNIERGCSSKTIN